MFPSFWRRRRILSSDILFDEFKVPDWYVLRRAQPILVCVALSVSNYNIVLFRLYCRPSSIGFLFKRGSGHRLGLLSPR